MKTCPICNAVAFDDAAICYGCLHHFDGGGDAGASAPSFEVTVPRTLVQGARPALVISVQAVPGSEGALDWRCDIDGRPVPVPMVS